MSSDMFLFLSMIIDECHIVDIARVPDEAESPVTANPQAELALSVSSKLFKETSRDGRQVLLGCRSVQEIKTISQSLVKFLRTFRMLSLKKLFQLFVFEVPDHGP